MTSTDESDGPGEGPRATPVQPAAHPVPPSIGQGEQAIPIGVPGSAEEWRALKRRADEPDPDAAQDDSGADPEAPPR